MNNGRAIQESGKNNNYSNMKTQCYFKLKELMEKRLVKVNADGDIQDKLSQELNNTMLKNELSDQKIQLESKDDMKRRIGRSPDIADAIMMRMYYELKPQSTGNSTIVTVNYDDQLY